MEGAGIDGGEDGGGDDGMVIKLVGGVMRGVDVEGVGLCHLNGDGNVGNDGRVGDYEGDKIIARGTWVEIGMMIGGN